MSWNDKRMKLWILIQNDYHNCVYHIIGQEGSMYEKYITWGELTPVIRPSFNYVTWHSWTEGRLQGSIRIFNLI